MTFLTYNTNIPNAPNNPSSDQPLMQTNTNSIGTWVAQDHYGFADSSGGLHKQVRMPVLGVVPTIGAATGCIYAKTVGGVSQLFYSQDASGKEYQLSVADTANFGTFSTNPGWTFLPGGLRLQYGTGTTTNLTTAVTFPVAFTIAVYSVVASKNTSSTYGVTNVTNAGFVFQNGASGATFYWLAIGV